MSKTKKVAGVDLSENCFAYVGDESDTSTWKLPIHFPGDQTKTVNFIKDALGRFHSMERIPAENIENVRFTIVGAAKACGVKVDETFIRRAGKTPLTNCQPQSKVQPTEAELAMHRELKELEAELASGEAMDDYKAQAILKALGID